jgi:hypothetical protein
MADTHMANILAFPHVYQIAEPKTKVTYVD